MGTIEYHDHGVLIRPKRPGRLALLLIVAAAFVAFTSFAISNWQQGRNSNALIGATVASVCALTAWRVARKSRSDSGQLWWIADTDGEGRAVGEPPAEATNVLLATAIKGVLLAYSETPGDEARDGWFQVFLQRSDGSDPLLADRRRPSGYLATLRLTRRLAERWQVPMRRKTSAKRAGLWMLSRRGALVFPLLGVPTLLYGGWVAWQQHTMRSWPQTLASIQSFEPGIGGGGEWHWYANPKIAYSYRVRERHYESTWLNPSPWNYQSEEAFRSDTSDFMVGAQVPCWYEPRRPQVAYVVNSGITPDSWLLVGIGIAGLLTYLLALRMVSGCERETEEFEKLEAA